MSIFPWFIDLYILCIISSHLGDKQIFNFRNISPIKSTNEYCLPAIRLSMLPRNRPCRKPISHNNYDNHCRKMLLLGRLSLSLDVITFEQD